MLELAQPLWLLLFGPLAFWLRAAWRQVHAEAPPLVLNHPALPLAAGQSQRSPSGRVPTALRALAWSLMIVALAQPRETGDWITPPPEGRDIVLVVDTSLTMSISDFRQNGREVERMTVLKDTLARFVEARAGDRFGVIVFGSEVATLTPPTFDRVHAIAQIRRLQVGMAGPDTALGDALGMALKQVETRRLRPALIVVSDGADNNAGSLTPAESLAVARQLGVAIHTMQFGSDPFAAGRAARVSTAGDPDPQPGLPDLSRLTAGRHFAIAGTEDVTRVVRAIDRLEPTLSPPARHRQVREWYWALLVAAATALVAARLLALRHAA